MRKYYLLGLSGYFFVSCAGQNIHTTEYYQSTEKKLWDMDTRLEQQEKRIAELNENLQEQQKAALAVRRETLAATTSLETPKTNEPQPIVKNDFPEVEEGESLASSEHDEIQLYYRGLQNLRSEKFDEAIKALEQFISENPNHVYTDRAEYLLTEAHFKKQDYGQVLLKYQVFRDRYPYSFKLPNIQMLRALALLELDQIENSEVALKEILSTYPHHEVFERANQKLVELKNKTTAQP